MEGLIVDDSKKDELKGHLKGALQAYPEATIQNFDEILRELREYVSAIPRDSESHFATSNVLNRGHDLLKKLDAAVGAEHSIFPSVSGHGASNKDVVRPVLDDLIKSALAVQEQKRREADLARLAREEPERAKMEREDIDSSGDDPDAESAATTSVGVLRSRSSSETRREAELVRLARKKPERAKEGVDSFSAETEIEVLRNKNNWLTRKNIALGAAGGLSLAAVSAIAYYLIRYKNVAIDDIKGFDQRVVNLLRKLLGITEPSRKKSKAA